MKKIIAIGLILVLIALSACTSNVEKHKTGDTNPVVENSVGDPVLDNITNTPLEIVNETELDTVMDNISMDDW